MGQVLHTEGCYSHGKVTVCALPEELYGANNRYDTNGSIALSWIMSGLQLLSCQGSLICCAASSQNHVMDKQWHGSASFTAERAMCSCY